MIESLRLWRVAVPWGAWPGLGGLALGGLARN